MLYKGDNDVVQFVTIAVWCNPEWPQIQSNRVRPEFWIRIRTPKWFPKRKIGIKTPIFWYFRKFEETFWDAHFTQVELLKLTVPRARTALFYNVCKEVVFETPCVTTASLPCTEWEEEKTILNQLLGWPVFVDADLPSPTMDQKIVGAVLRVC